MAGHTRRIILTSGGCVRNWMWTLVQTMWTLQTGLTFSSSTFCTHSVFMCFVWISEQTVIISLYSINWLVFIIETECVYCAVRTGSLYIIAGREAPAVGMMVLSLPVLSAAFRPAAHGRPVTVTTSSCPRPQTIEGWVRLPPGKVIYLFRSLQTVLPASQ
jgi:hypothetical protein